MRVASGRRYVSAALAATIADDVVRGSVPPHERLSDREFLVLRELAAGKTVSQIAGELSLSVKTISTYRTRLLEKMHMTTTAELMHYAIANQLAK